MDAERYTLSLSKVSIVDFPIVEGLTDTTYCINGQQPHTNYYFLSLLFIL